MLVQQLDDRNSSIIYAGTWGSAGISPEFENTTTWSNVTGSTATVNFSGTSISVWGTIPPAGLGVAPQSSYSIDNRPVSTFTGSQISTTQYNQRFFQSDQLASANHTLKLETLANGGYFYLDYLLIVPSDPSTTASPTASQTPLSKKALPVGTITGGVLGVVGLVVLAIVCILIIRRRMNDRRNRQKAEVTISLWSKFPSTKTGLTPFIAQPYRPLSNNNYGADHQADYSSFISLPPLQDPFETYRSSSSAQTSRLPNYSHPFTEAPVVLRDHLPTSKAAALLERQGTASASASVLARPQDRYNIPPPNYNE